MNGEKKFDMGTYKGKFHPLNPSKYIGDKGDIIYRSSWEKSMMEYCDQKPYIMKWSSEPFAIPYYSSADQKMRRYFPDFLVEVKGKRETKIILIEVKPFKETKAPRKNKNKRRYLNECYTWQVNSDKWKAAEVFCEKQGWLFQKFTEYELGIKKRGNRT